MPEITDKGFILHNQRENLIGKTHVEMLIPNSKMKQLEVFSGAEANSSLMRLLKKGGTRYL
jgi:hypothetical protein